MKKRILLVFNARFPYEKSEDFLSNELDFEEGFDQIICFPILVFGNKTLKDITYKRNKTEITFYNPNSSYLGDNKKIKLLTSILLNRYVYQELFYLFKSKKLSIKNVKNLMSFLLISYNSVWEFKNKVYEVIKKNNVVIYSYWMHCNALSVLLLKDKIKENVNVEKVVTRCHRFDLYEYANEDNYLPMRNHIFSQIDEIHSISDDGIKYLTETYPNLDSSKLYLSRLGTIDRGVKIFPKSTTLHLVSCSWMRPVKRVASIVNAIAGLSIELDWVHYGDGEEYSKIEKLVGQINNPLISCTLKGAFKNERVLEEYALNHYDVFINVSENEGVPVSIMEAMSFGKIIIATDVGGTSEIVENGVNGFLLSKDFTNEDLVIIINKIASLDANQFDAMCQHSRRIWEEKCNAEFNYNKFYKNL